MLVILIMMLLAVGGYVLGRGNFSVVYNPPGAVTTTAPTPTLTPTPKATKTVSAGVASGLSFGLYTIDVPDAWTVKQEHEDEPSPMDTLTITKGTYSIKIFQAATGGAMCLFPGDPDFEGPSSRYDTFVAITTKDGTALRRGGTTATSGSTRGFTLCQKGTETYGQPTGYGHINFTTPATPDLAILAEMDAMIASLMKR